MKKAYQYMKKGCEFGDGAACLYMGMMITSKDDIGVEKNEVVIKEGLEMMRKACYEMKEPRGCSILGKMYLNGVKDFVAKDEKSAYTLFEKSCNDGDDSSACFTLAQMLGRGVGVEKNMELAHKFRKKAAEIEEDNRKNSEIKFQQGAFM